jgi:hypothetical protein
MYLGSLLQTEIARNYGVFLDPSADESLEASLREMRLGDLLLISIYSVS